MNEQQIDRDRLRELADEYDDSTIDGGPDAAAGAIRRLLDALDRAEAERDQARAHLAAQEPDDEAQEWENEVAAALPERYDGEEDQRDIILRAVKDMAARDAPEPTAAEVEAASRTWAESGPTAAVWEQMIEERREYTRERMRACLSAARAARRDEEKQDG